MKTTITLLIAVMLCGCASAGRNFDSRKIAEIKKGQTTEAQLLKMFGPPNQRGISSESGATLIWVYTEVQVRGTTFIPVVGMFAGGADSRNKTLTVTLNANGTVETYNYSSGTIGSSGTASGTSERFENATVTPPARSPKDGGYQSPKAAQ